MSPLTSSPAGGGPNGIDPIPPAALARYRERRGADLTSLSRAHAAADWATIEEIGHRLKGNGETFGFPEISILGGQFESAAVERDAQAVSTALARLGDWLGARAPESSSSLSLR